METLLAKVSAPEGWQYRGQIDKQKYTRKIKQMFEERRKWETRWKEIRDYQLPYIGQFDDTADSTDPARRKDVKISQGTAWKACQTFAAGIMSGLTPPSRQWFKLAFSNPSLAGMVDVQRILDERQAVIEAKLHESNFYNAVHSVYMELPFGQCPMPIFYSPEVGLRFTPLTIGTYALEVDSHGRVSCVARRCGMTLEQLVTAFGIDALPQPLQDAARRKQFNSNQRYRVNWLVEKNDERLPGYLHKLNMPYRSVYWLDESNSKDVLYVGGFEENSIPVARYLVNGLDPYAKGPGWFAEGDSKMLQVMHKDWLTALELMTKPPMKGPAMLMNNGGISLIPGAFTPVDDTSNQNVQPLFNVNMNLQHVSEEIEKTKKSIRDAYSADLFLMLDQIQHGQMTAREIMERTNEKLQQLGPVVERLQDEFLTVVIERVYHVLERAGAFPPIDPEVAVMLEEEEVKIDYISPLAQAQKMSGLVNIEQGLAMAGQMAQLFPDTLKLVDEEGTYRKYMELLGAPAEMLRSREQVQEMRIAEQQAMAEQAQMAQEREMAQNAVPMTQAAKNLTEVAQAVNPAYAQWLGV